MFRWEIEEDYSSCDDVQTDDISVSSSSPAGTPSKGTDYLLINVSVFGYLSDFLIDSQVPALSKSSNSSQNRSTDSDI